MVSFFSIIFFLYFYFITCSFNNIFNNKEDFVNKEKDFKRNLQQTGFNPIRIHVETSFLRTQFPNIVEFNEIETAILKAKNTLENLINVTTLTEKIPVNDVELYGFDKTKMGDGTIFFNGIDADLVIFIRASDQTLEDGKINRDDKVFAIPKILKKHTDNRPIVGVIIYGWQYNYKVRDINDKNQRIELLSSIFLHEMIHILGFMDSSFQDFRNYNDIFGTKEVNRLNLGNKNKIIVKSENVLKRAKKYFNCPNIDSYGIEIENQDNVEELSNSHWEARILLGDIMTSDIYFQEQIISEFTLALLEESEWYKVNYYTGGLMKFGMHKGCEFLTNDCITAKETEVFSNEFCSIYLRSVSKSQGTCSIGRLSRGYCLNFISSFPDSEKEYKRFDHTFYGLRNAEYCPVSNHYIEITSSNYDGNYNGNCLIGNDKYGNEINFINGDQFDYTKFSNSIGQVYGNTSFCALSSVIRKDETAENIEIYGKQIRPTCYPMFCSDKSLTILIKNLYVVCPNKGQIIKVDDDYYIDSDNYIGYILCPDYNSICTGTELCNNMFDCASIGSRIRDEEYSYNYTPDNVINEVTISTYNEDYYKDKVVIGYELSDNGLCPKDCIKCHKNRRCLKCRDYNNKRPYYIGVSETDPNGQIECMEEPPKEGYYKSKNDDHQYYKCIENCLECEDANYCLKCNLSHFINENRKCEERIPGCKDYNKQKFIDYTPCYGNNCTGYKECENCNNSANYFCIDEIKTKCILLNDYNNKTFYNIEDKNFPCIGRCSERFLNCIECNKTTCLKCKNDKNYLINNFGNCIEIIPNCEIQRYDVNESECSKCYDTYNCIGKKKSECIQVDNMKYFHELTDSNCIERCSTSFPNCVECNKDGCLICKDDHFVYNGQCIENITGCIKNQYDGLKKECYECNSNRGYFCFNQSKEICYRKDINSILPYYYLMPNINYPCYSLCDTLVKHCSTCNSEKCIECISGYIINDDGTYCIVKPFEIPENDNCTLVPHYDYNKTINEIDPWDFVDYYWADNIPYTRIVDHYIGNNYIVTVFMYPECTNFLLESGYFKINSTELQNLIIKEAHIEGMKILFCVYITYNYKSYLQFHNIESYPFNPYNFSSAMLSTEYIIVNNFSNSLNDILGPVVLDLVLSEKIEILDRDSDVYNNICKNVTFFGIDMPLKKRLNYLYFHKYSEQLLCFSENCTIEGNDYNNVTTTCKCRLGNLYKDILKGEKFEFIPYEEITNSNDFIDSLSIIKCSIKGLNIKNIKTNIGFFLCVFAIAIQISLFIYYSLCSKPIKNINKNINMSSPPKKSLLTLMSDWERNTKDCKDCLENEIYVQPRDDAEDQLLEEEKSYSNDGNFFDESNLSIDTNVGGAIKNISTGNKINLKEKANQKRVLILLNNKKSNNEDIISDNDIVPIGDDKKKEENLDFGRLYWYVLSLKQHIINYFSFIICCKMTESFIPIPIRLIRSIFMIILTFVINILCFNQSYYETKFGHFNEKYKFIYTQRNEINIPTSEKVIYAIGKGFGKAMISFLILLVVQLIIGILFFSIRKKVIKAKKMKSHEAIKDLTSKVKIKYLVFFIINLVLMTIFFFTISGFCGAYGGGFVDYFTASIISLIFLEIFPFLWSVVIALIRYLGIKKNNAYCFKISEFFMF